MDEFLTKPLRLEALGEALERCCRRDAADGGTLADAAPAPDPAVPVLDETQLAQLRSLPGATRPQLLDELVEIFRQDLPDSLRSLRQLAEQRDVGGLVTAAHRIAGSASSLGAEPFRAAALAVESAARGSDWAGLPGRLAALEREWERLRSALESVSSQPR